MKIQASRTAYRFLSGLLLGIGLSTLAAAQDLQVGEDVFKNGRPPAALACTTCHGADATGMPGFPRLAGTGQKYLLEQMDAFASGARENAIMKPIAGGLSDDERVAVAAYLSQLSPPDLQAPDAADHEAGLWLAERGHWDQGIPACMQCHGPSGQGVGESFPPLAGLSADYIKEQIGLWQEGKRQDGPLGLMPAVAKALQGDDLEAVAAYYSAFETAADSGEEK